MRPKKNTLISADHGCPVTILLFVSHYFGYGLIDTRALRTEVINNVTPKESGASKNSGDDATNRGTTTRSYSMYRSL